MIRVSEPFYCESCGHTVKCFGARYLHFYSCVEQILGYKAFAEKFEPESRVFFLTKGWKL